MGDGSSVRYRTCLYPHLMTECSRMLSPVAYVRQRLCPLLVPALGSRIPGTDLSLTQRCAELTPTTTARTV